MPSIPDPTRKPTNSQTRKLPPASRPAGRPTKCTPQVRAAILHCIAMGLNFERACRAAGITSETLRVWRKNDPLLAEDIAQAEGQAILAHLDVLDAACQKNWRAAAWWLERKCPESFGKTQPLTVSEKLRLADLNRALVFDDQLDPSGPESRPVPSAASTPSPAENQETLAQNPLPPAPGPSPKVEPGESPTPTPPLQPAANHPKTPKTPRKPRKPMPVAQVSQPAVSPTSSRPTDQTHAGAPMISLPFVRFRRPLANSQPHKLANWHMECAGKAQRRRRCRLLAVTSAVPSSLATQNS